MMHVEFDTMSGIRNNERYALIFFLMQVVGVAFEDFAQSVYPVLGFRIYGV